MITHFNQHDVIIENVFIHTTQNRIFLDSISPKRTYMFEVLYDLCILKIVQNILYSLIDNLEILYFDIISQISNGNEPQLYDKYWF